MTSGSLDESVLERLFAALEEDSADPDALAARLGVSAAVVRRCAGALQALKSRDAPPPAPARRPRSGARIGPYELRRQAGKGGVGLVFQAIDLRAPELEPVALKLLIQGRAAGEPQRARFEREARALLQLRHPGVVALVDAGAHEGSPFLALEWVEGESLQERLDRDGPLDPHLAADLVIAVAGALAHCHARGVLHRDLKPSNVLVKAADGMPLLVDFGLARDLDGSSLTATGAALGTPSYWPPEQARGDLRAIGPRSDVWGLGALLFALLTGEPPIAGRTQAELAAAVYRPPPPPSELRKGTPAFLDRVCRRALSIDPAARFASATELRDELLGWRHGRPSRRRGARVFASLLLLPFLVTAVLLLLPAERPPPAEDPWEIAERGLLLEKAGDLPGARQCYDRALELDPEHTAALSARGGLRGRQGDPRAGLVDLDRALELAPDDPGALSNRASAHMMLSQFAQALADLDRLVSRYPDHVLVRCDRGLARLESGDAKGALADLDRALELDPACATAHAFRAEALAIEGDADGARRALDLALRHAQGSDDVVHQVVDGVRARLEDAAPQREGTETVPALVARARQLQLQGDTDGAARLLDRAIELGPDHASGWQSRGCLRAFLGHPGALSDLERALELDPNDASAHIGRGWLAHQRGQTEQALADYTRAIELAPEDEVAYGHRAILRAERGDVTGATADFERAISLDPSSPANRDRGVARLRWGLFSDALADLDRAIAHHPEDAVAHAYRGACLARLGDPAGARQALDVAVRLEPDHPVVRNMVAQVERELPQAAGSPETAQQLVDRGRRLQLRDDMPGALACFERALELAPEDASAWAARGAHRAVTGHPGAQADLERALQLDPKSVDAMLVRGFLARSAGRVDEATAIFDRAIELAPGNARAWLNRALLRGSSGDLAGALSDLDRAVALDPALATRERGTARLHDGDLEGALADFDRAIALDNRDALAHAYRGGALAELGDFASARRSLEEALRLVPDASAISDVVARVRAEFPQLRER